MVSNIRVATKSKLVACQLEADSYFSCYSLQNIDCDILALKFDEDIEKSKEILKNILPQIRKPLMICGCGKDDVDCILLPELIKVLDRECIISYITEKNYKDIIPSVISGGHYAVLKTPIDINLAKELNILCMKLGLSSEKIIMNTDIGALGYGYEYGYSIMEKVIQEAQKGDSYLDMPLISEAALEVVKTKEYKTGSDEARVKLEICASSGAIAAGANIVVMNSAQGVKTVKELI